jgi:hypothetical protein
MLTDFSHSSFYHALTSEYNEIQELKWLESEKANADIGIDLAITIWVREHKSGWVESRKKDK